jgi:PAS domain S-box-containing protein
VANKRTASEFDEDDERALVLLAEYAALVIEAAMATEAEMRERAQLRAILDQLPESVVVMDGAGRLIPNAKALQYRVDGGGRVDSGGQPVQFEMRHPDGKRVTWEQLPLVRSFRKRDTVSDVELLLVARDGRRVPVLVNSAPILDQRGELLGAVEVWREIEQLKRLERLREEWAAMVAHDLRQPLSVIQAWDQVLGLQPARPARDQRAVEAIDEAVVRMNEMLQELIDTSLLEAHRVELRRSSVRIDELVRKAVEAHQSKRAPLRLELAPELPELEIDRARIERVLDNLLSNAQKYGTPGEEVTVTAAQRDGGVEVAVTNLGSTLPPDEIPSLFSRFYRTRSARAKRGLGLGLYIAKSFIEAHGGRIACESHDGRTTFRFTLPLRPEARSDPPPPV